MSTKLNKPATGTPSIVGADVRLKGNLITSGEVQFDGMIEGDLRCGSLTIGESAEVTGGIIADTVIVHGTIRGTIRARNVRLERDSKVVGDVWHEDLGIASGAHIEGHCMRVENALDDVCKSPKTPAQTAKKVDAPKAAAPSSEAKTDVKPANAAQ